ncbi:hypothetical protein A374_16388 [Fictibacillus macauensis ZFHKF-1]|uniref:Uncharacterized protein n=2 Tax=Fictibacillus TaxID=1329200 RepID=I8AFH1_9BACL|nr:hypothetical protein A374_16388 [Fictibacillus macauensis ZFHKF-1]
MTNSLKFKNILCILKFFYNDTFHGLFNRPFFRSKVNRYGIILILILLYLGYFYLNMVELNALSNIIQGRNSANLMFAAKMTLSSYFNVILILSALLFILVNSTVSLSKNSLFFAKTLPFSEKEVSVSQMIFKLSVALAFFELLIIIVIPTLKLIPMNIFTACLVLMTLHTLFISSFFIFDLIYTLVLKDTTFTKRILLTFALDFLIVVLVMVHFLVTRFKVDAWTSVQKESILVMTCIVFFASLMIGTIAYLLNSMFFAKDNIYVHLNYFKIVLPAFSIGLATTMPAIIRSKNFLYFWALLIVISIGSFIQNGLDGTLQLWLFLLPILGIVAITYGDAMISVRKLFSIYKISPLTELISLLGVSIILMSPALYVGIAEKQSLDPFMYGINIFFVATIAGFLFPKSQSNVNETIASVLTFVIMIILSALISFEGALYPSLIILLCVLYLILRKEYEVPR